jgi:hypothetical protein
MPPSLRLVQQRTNPVRRVGPARQALLQAPEGSAGTRWHLGLCLARLRQDGLGQAGPVLLSPAGRRRTLLDQGEVGRGKVPNLRPRQDHHPGLTSWARATPLLRPAAQPILRTPVGRKGNFWGLSRQCTSSIATGRWTAQRKSAALTLRLSIRTSPWLAGYKLQRN